MHLLDGEEAFGGAAFVSRLAHVARHLPEVERRFVRLDLQHRTAGVIAPSALRRRTVVVGVVNRSPPAARAGSTVDDALPPPEAQRAGLRGGVGQQLLRRLALGPAASPNSARASDLC